METIVDKFILQLESQLADRKVAITLTAEARAWLGKKGYDKVFGARPLGRVIQKEVRDPLTDEILFGTLEHGGNVTIDLSDDKLAFVRRSCGRRDSEPQTTATRAVGKRDPRRRQLTITKNFAELRKACQRAFLPTRDAMLRLFRHIGPFGSRPCSCRHRMQTFRGTVSQVTHDAALRQTLIEEMQRIRVGQQFGGAIAMTNATTRHSSAAMLRHLGGTPLESQVS